MRFFSENSQKQKFFFVKIVCKNFGNYLFESAKCYEIDVINCPCFEKNIKIYSQK